MISFRSSIVCDRCIDSSFIDSLLEFCDNNIEFDEDVIIKDSNGTVLGAYLYIKCTSGNCDKYKN